MIRYTKEEGHANFVYKVVAPLGISFHIKDRYSSMRQFQSLLKKDLDDKVNTASLPPFPKKKFLKALETAFLDKR